MSTLIRNTVPASLRKPVMASRFSQELMAWPQRTAFAEDAGMVLATKSRFAPMRNEPDDARMTGVTRSLDRRLLALNVQGSLSQTRVFATRRSA